MNNPIRRLSTVFKASSTSEAKGIQATSGSGTNALLEYLTNTKTKYLTDIKDSPARAKDYLVVMGNEAGDLDSVASSIAYAWISSQTRPSISFIQIRRDDLVLRPENIYALDAVGIKSPRDQLLLPDDLSSLPAFPATKFALVDHNRLGSSFVSNGSIVEAIIDHHEDEHEHPTADPRLVSPAGSCSSHVALMAPDTLPTELASLLLSAILIDTNGLKPGGKATQVDLDAVTRLLPLMQPRIQKQTSVLHEIPSLKKLSTRLEGEKSNVTHLTPRDHLRRDYKEYSLTLSWHADKPTIKAGLSTVPVRLKDWASKGQLLAAGTAYMKERDLAVLGVLTSFRKESTSPLKARGKHAREMAWLVLSELELEQRLWKGLEADEELQVKSHNKFKVKETADGVSVRVYKQGNAKATRKATAPILKKILEAES